MRGPLGYGTALDDTAGAQRGRWRAALASAVDDVQPARGLIEHDRAVVAADRDVLDPGAVLAGQVEAGLDAERHAGPQRQLVPGHEVRILVALEADAVSRPMEEALAVAFGLDRSARRGV